MPISNPTLISWTKAYKEECVLRNLLPDLSDVKSIKKSETKFKHQSKLSREKALLEFDEVLAGVRVSTYKYIFEQIATRAAFFDFFAKRRAKARR